jgi:hypothetical protein
VEAGCQPLDAASPAASFGQGWQCSIEMKRPAGRHPNAFTMKRLLFTLFLFFLLGSGQGQSGAGPSQADTAVREGRTAPLFQLTASFLDAAINTVNALDGLLKKEAYRTRIISLNNPASADMGFKLEHEVRNALRPLLDKAKSVNSQKFNSVVSSLLHAPAQTGGSRPLLQLNPLFPTLLGLVGNLAVQEKRITREDLDSFVQSTARFFLQFEKLHGVNRQFDQQLDRLEGRLREIQFDLRELLLDLTGILYRETRRGELKARSSEALFLSYLERGRLEERWQDLPAPRPHYPSSGLTTAREIAHSLQKLFDDYQKVYQENFQQVKTILQEARGLGRSVNGAQIDASTRELEQLYAESRTADGLSLRMTTLFSRLQQLADLEQKNW